MLKTKTQYEPMNPGEQMLVVISNLDEKTNANKQLRPMLRGVRLSKNKSYLMENRIFVLSLGLLVEYLKL